MQGSAVMGCVQQPVWVKGSLAFAHKGSVAGGVGFPHHQVRLSGLKSCRCSSQLEANAVTGRSSSSVSVAAPGIGGSYQVFNSWYVGYVLVF